jgi:8-oxo-dGTP pyrophosphatase MutT (NUDIX family)
MSRDEYELGVLDARHDSAPDSYAAGVMFVAPDGTALFLQRSPNADHPAEYCFPGGTRDGNETPEETAKRETIEEIGHWPKGELQFLCTTLSDWAGKTDIPELSTPGTVAFTNYIMKVAEPFIPELSVEHTGFSWAPLAAPPEPLHPACRVAIARMGMHELDVARAIASGQLASPQKFKNVWLFAIRITGTGASYRVALKEFVWRDPALYMTEEFCARCNGLPVIWEHPKKTGTLDSKEFSDRVVGGVMLPYLMQEKQEVWGIARIYDEAAAQEMIENDLSTSPAVVLKDPGGGKSLSLDDGSKLLIESDASLLDHVAICSLGVWDKGGEPTGVRSDGVSSMTEEEKAAAEKKERDDKARKDAAEKEKADAAVKAKADEEAKAKADSETIDKVLKGIDSLCTGMADVGKRMDAFEAREKERTDAAKRDSMSAEEREKADKVKKDADDKEKAEAKDRDDKARKDAAEKEEKERDDAAKADAAALKTRFDALEALAKPRADEDEKALADAQARADSVYHAWGEQAPRFLAGESLNAYTLRLVRKFQSHSPDWKEKDLSKLDSAVLAIAEGQIFKSAVIAAERAVDVPAGQLRQIRKPDDSGRMISTFRGRQTFIAGMKRPSLRVTDIRVPQERN